MIFPIHMTHPHDTMFSMRVFLHSSTSSYYVVSLYTDEENKDKLKLLDLGSQSNDPRPYKDLSWRNINIPEYDKTTDRLRDYYVTHYISEYGILFTFSVGSSIHIIVSVDLVQEVCTIVNVPESLSSGFRGIRNQLWRGKLTFCFVSEEKLNVCVLEDYKNTSGVTW